MLPPSFDVEHLAYPTAGYSFVEPSRFRATDPAEVRNAHGPETVRTHDPTAIQWRKPHEHDGAHRSPVREDRGRERHRAGGLLGGVVRTVPSVRAHLREGLGGEHRHRLREGRHRG